jgi:hypothetical protein
LETAKKRFEEEEYLQALAILDKMVERLNSTIIRHLRAAIREIVNDLVGSLLDITTENDTSNRIFNESAFTSQARV